MFQEVKWEIPEWHHGTQSECHNGGNFCYWPIPYYYLCFQQSSESPRHTVIGKIPLQCNSVLLHIFSLFARRFYVSCVCLNRSQKALSTPTKQTNTKTTKKQTSNPDNDTIWCFWNAWVSLFNHWGGKVFRATVSGLSIIYPIHKWLKEQLMRLSWL